MAGAPLCWVIGWGSAAYLLAEESGDGDGFVAVWAVAADADATHEGSTLVAVLLAEGPGAAELEVVDGDRFQVVPGGRTTGGSSTWWRRR